MGDLEATLGRALLRSFAIPLSREVARWWNSLAIDGKIIAVTVVFTVICLLLTFDLKRYWSSRMILAKIESRQNSVVASGSRTESFVQLGKTKLAMKSIWGLLKRWRLLAISISFCSAYLFVAAFSQWPYNFYILLRIVTSFSSVWLAISLHRQRNHAWQVPAVVIAVIFNPIAPLRFDRATWETLNLVAGVLLILAFCFFLKRDRDQLKQETSALAVDSNENGISSVRRQVSYRYCPSCDTLVLRTDSFCKQCGTSL